jgi:[ribosomal protein S18]-alanine N-acetyltransferase
MMTGWHDRRPAARRPAARPDDEVRPDDAVRPEDAAGPGGGPGTLLRPMLPADLASVLALEHELFPDDPWSAQMFAEEVAQPPSARLYLVAEADDASGPVAAAAGHGVAGYAGIMFIPGGVQADVLTIAVARAYWGRGIGSALLGALLQAAVSRGCTEVFLEVRKDNQRARGLYLRRGFEEIGVRRGYYQPSGVDAIVMRKDLRR